VAVTTTFDPARLCGALLAATLTLWSGGVTHAAIWRVSPARDPAVSDRSASPPNSIQAALDRAAPGDVIELAPGDYFEDIHSVRHGTQAEPITLRGVRASVIRGDGRSSRVIQINHDFHRLVGFTVDGLAAGAGRKAGYRDKLIYVQGREPDRGVAGTLIDALELRNAGGECLRLRYYVTRSEIRNSRFVNCGVHDFRFAAGGKNGEGIYLGTSSTQWADGKNPTDGPDRSRDNWIHHNVFVTRGNECVDIKEGAERNLIEHNLCERQLDPESAGFDSRGDYNVFRYNVVRNNEGAAFRFGGHEVQGRVYGIGNQAYDNVIGSNRGGGVKIVVTPQGMVCGNRFEDPGTRQMIGAKAAGTDPSKPCPPGVAGRDQDTQRAVATALSAP